MNELERKLFDQTWNYKNRKNIISRLKERTYDVVVIGGGITGVGVAREAAMRDLKVALVDMQDFAGGTSSRSSKLAHGGIRYLSHGDFDLVQESTTERNWLLAHATTVRPLPFLFVSFEGGKYNKRTITSATKIYDFLGDKDPEFKIYKPHKWYKPEEIFDIEPHYKSEGNLGGAIYYDCNVDDARLTIETLKEAIIRGADAVNYCKVIEYLKDKGKIIGVKCKDLENDIDFEIKATLVVNSTGIWTDRLLNNYPDDIPKPLIRPTKGVHLQFRRKHIQNNVATIISSESDGRSIFVIPRDGEFTIVGTTDTDYDGDLTNPFCDKDDADYLIKSVKYYFPDADLDYENILSTYAGIRPLVMQKGKAESEVSRKHIIFFSNDGLLTITGGKLTAWRAMAEDLFKHVEERDIFPDIKREVNFSKQKFIIRLEKDEWLTELKNSKVKLDEDILDHIFQQYSKGATKILELIKENDSLKERIVDENYFTKAEILYVLRYEMTPHLIDLFCRRTEMSLWIKHDKAKEAAEKVAELMAKEYSWSEEKKNNEIQTYMEYIKKTVAFIK